MPQGRVGGLAMSIHTAFVYQSRPARSASPGKLNQSKLSHQLFVLVIKMGDCLVCAVLSDQEAWARMPAMQAPCGACTASLPCPKARAISLSQRHRAARALLVSPGRIRCGHACALSVQDCELCGLMPDHSSAS